MAALPAARSSAARRRSPTGSSLTMAPSRIVDDALACSAATSGSWVTMTIVLPLVVELLEEAHDLQGHLGVEVARRLVGQDAGPGR